MIYYVRLEAILKYLKEFSGVETANASAISKPGSVSLDHRAVLQHQFCGLSSHGHHLGHNEGIKLQAVGG